VTANDDYYISCVLSVVREWYSQGQPRKKVTEPDFREWSDVMDWIVQEIFGMAPLLTGHRAEQARISNPNLNFLRDVALALKKDNGLGKGYGPSEIALICGEHGIDIPGIKGPCDPSKSNLQVGSILRRLFKDTDAVTVADIEVSHTTSEQYNVVNRHTEKRNIYFFQ
jgi:hypothetical protein